MLETLFSALILVAVIIAALCIIKAMVKIAIAIIFVTFLIALSHHLL
jgi:hypothetical protein